MCKMVKCVYLIMEVKHMRPARIVVAGYVSCDITPSFEGQGEKSGRLSDYIRPGALVEVGKATIAPGGCVTNTGLALQFFGADTVLMAKIGDDAFGRNLRESYAARGAKADFVVSPDTETSYTLAIAPPGCDRVFFADPGANHTYRFEEIDLKIIGGAGYFHFGYPTLMKRFYENGAADTVRLFKEVKRLGVVTSLDMTMVDPSSPAAKEDWPSALQHLLPYVDFFTPSYEEMCALIWPDHYQMLLARTGGEDVCLHLSLREDVEPLAERLLGLGAHAVLLKCGAAGIFLATSPFGKMAGLGEQFADPAWGDLRLFADSYRPDRIASGTGAGDTAIAAFLYSIMHHMKPAVCLENAAATGAMNLTEYDSLSGLLPIEALRRRIDGGWERQHLIRP